MPLISQSIPNLINGVSQQTATQRNITQAEEQLNAQSHLVEGLMKRPPLEYIGQLSSSPTDTTNLLVGVQRDAATAFTILFKNNDLEVHNLSGVAQTVTFPNGNSYLTSSSPKDHFKTVTVADFTFVMNTSITPVMQATTSVAKIERSLVYIKLSQYGVMYEVTVNHPNMSYPIAVQFQMPSGKEYTTDQKLRDTKKIADILCFGTGSTYYDSTADAISFKTIRTDTGATLSSSEGLKNYSGITNHFTTALYNSVIDIKPTDNNAAYNVDTSDGYGANAMYAIGDEIQDFAKLPYYSPTDAVIKVTGDKGDSLSDYYVKFNGKGVWKETIGPGVKISFDATTMPHALVNNNNGTFTFKQLTWNDRICGDEDTNADPSFVNATFQNITFYKNRLGFLSGENVILSESGEYYSFFATTMTDSLDTDPIDISAASTQVSTLKHSVAYNEQLLLFSDTAQFIMSSSDGTISPKNATIASTTTFEHESVLTPLQSGNFVYFVQERSGFSTLREYFADDTTQTNDSTDIGANVSQYIPENLKAFAVCPMENSLFLAKYGNIYVYKYFWNGEQKIQASWSTWNFPTLTIIGMFVVDSFLYIYANDSNNDITRFNIYRLDLQNTADTNLTFKVALDQREYKVGSYDSLNNLTTFTSSFNSVQHTIQGVNYNTGAPVTLTNTGTFTYTTPGNVVEAYLGEAFDTTYTFSTQYLREQAQAGNLSVTSGRMQIRTLAIDYQESSFFQVEVTPNGRTVSIYDLNANTITGTPISTVAFDSGVFKIPVQTQNTEVTIKIKSNSPLPFKCISAELESYYHRRSQRG